ncbi:hypothetical protein, partial [Saccharothrix sp. ST-888]|uniref:hypothetical protein n=1 Tax=Saccharothrix sp. ST-888 TaxID=1427391 RepID=UPI0005EC7B78
QPARNLRTQRTRTTRHQHRAARLPRLHGLTTRSPHQTTREHTRSTYRDLVLTSGGSEHSSQPAEHTLVH